MTRASGFRSFPFWGTYLVLRRPTATRLQRGSRYYPSPLALSRSNRSSKILSLASYLSICLFALFPLPPSLGILSTFTALRPHCTSIQTSCDPFLSKPILLSSPTHPLLVSLVVLLSVHLAQNPRCLHCRVRDVHRSSRDPVLRLGTKKNRFILQPTNAFL